MGSVAGIDRRWLVAGLATVVAVVFLVATTVVGSGDDDPSSDAASTSTTELATAPSTAAPTIAVQPDWYRKETSRYSDRRPVATESSGVPTVTTEAPASSEGSRTTGTGRTGSGTSTRQTTTTGG